jgi:hypothetical protein
MKTIKFLMIALVATMFLTSCTENYSNGERIGMITKFSQKGLIWSSWEGSLNTTQTGMNSATPFEFSVDNDVNDPKATLDSAATEDQKEYWKVKIKYHETFGKNWLSNRGETNYFVKEVEVLDKDPMGSVFGNKSDNSTGGKVVDTVYVVIVPKEKVIK